MIATKETFGQAITKLAHTYPAIMVLDGDTSNSTRTDLFKEQFPSRYIECFIAEQNMVGMATGMSRLGKIPVVSAFAAFLTRAFDQIRMASISKANIKLVGSYCGVSIGLDGSSQMALEDISMMRSIFGSTVLYPADSVVTEKLVEQMIKTKGICYLRTTREKTPIIYQDNEEFPIGGFKIHKSKVQMTNVKPARQSLAQASAGGPNSKSKCVIIAAGITLHEALKAQEELGKVGVEVTVVDLYSIKPINKEELVQALGISKQTGVVTNIMTVEDHYFEGGLGDAVLNVFADVPNVRIKKLAVTTMPHSGTPAENLRRAGIDKEGIIQAILQLFKLLNVR